MATKKHRNTCLIINMSGGKDSVAMMGILRQRYPEVAMLAVYADTGFEHVKPVSAEDWAREICFKFGVPFYVVRNPNKTYLEMVEKRGKFPGTDTRQCTSDLKRDPIATWVRQSIKNGLIPQKYIVNCMGLRAAESPKRAKRPVLAKNRRESKAGRIVWDWLPIKSLSLAEVLEWHWKNEVKLHPVYVPEYHAPADRAGSTGYLRRFSCRVCIFSTKADLQAIYHHDREAFDLVANLEQKINFTMKNGESLFQIIGQDLSDASQYGSEEEMPCV